MSVSEYLKSNSRWNKFIESNMVKSVGEKMTWVGNYILTTNNKDYRIGMQKRLSPVNWLRDDRSSTIDSQCNNDSTCIVKEQKSKIKIRFFHHQSNMWNSIASVYKAFDAEEYDLLVVLTGTISDITSLKLQMKKESINYIELSNYDVKTDMPDITIIYHIGAWPTYKNSLNNLRNFTKLLVEIPLCVINPFSSTELYVKYMFQDEIRPDICILDKYAYNLAISNDNKHHNYIMSGNPKFDSIFDIMNKREVPKGWEKIKDKKKIILYTTDHGISLNRVYSDVSFDLYAKKLFQYFAENTDMALVFRPHSTLINELIKTFWSYSDYNTFRKLIENSKNIVWDETDNYAYAYSLADAIITDINCDVTCSSLVAGKPIAVVERFDKKVEAYNKCITDTYYRVESESDLVSFFEMVKQGNVDYKEKQDKLMKTLICHFDGGNGSRIQEIILNAYTKKVEKEG